jgi:hypothetical protein
MSFFAEHAQLANTWEISPENVRGGWYRQFFEGNLPRFSFCRRMPNQTLYILPFRECLIRPPHISFVGDYLNSTCKYFT